MSAFLLLLLAMLWAPAHAQEPVVVMPAVTFQAPAAIAPEAFGEAEQVVVQLEVDVADDGRVLDARPLDAPNEAFEVAAREALLAYRFSPATVDGEVTGVTIVYGLTFSLERLPRPAVEGVVRRAGEKTPLADATLELQGPDGAVAYAKSGEDGGFIVYDLDPGAWTVTVVGPGYRPETAEVTIEEDRVAQLKLFVVIDRDWEADDGIEVVEVVARLGSVEVNERAIEVGEAMSLPGTGGDVLRAILNFPGVARPPLGIAQLVVRGTDQDATTYYVDGVRIPQVFHFGGLSTVLNGDSLAEIRFLNGNYSVRYGDGLGGVVDLVTDPVPVERSTGYVSVDLYQASVFSEFKLSPKTTLTVSGRRSYADAVLGPVLSAVGGGGAFQAPRFYDAQLRLLHRTSGGTVIDALAVFSDDQFRLLQADGENVQLGLGTTFLTASLGVRAPMGKGWRSETRGVVGPERQSFSAGDTTSFDESVTFNLRQEFERLVPEGGHVGWRFGADLFAAAERFELGGFGTVALDEGEIVRLRPAAYAENTLSYGPVDVITGVRGSLLVLPEEATVWSVDPRVAMKAELGASTSLIATVGRFSQFPSSRELLSTSRGNPDLGPEWSLQSSLGLVQNLPKGWSIEATGYFNETFDLVVGREGRFDFTAGPPAPAPLDTGAYANDGIGRAYGLEVLTRLQARRAAVWVSATLGRAERRGRPDQERTPFQFDQTLNVNALATYELPKRWVIGGRVRVGTGNPVFDVNNRFYSLDSRAFVPIFANDLSRLRTYWALDLRVDKTWTFKRWELTAYLDIQGITDPGNTELPGYSYDFSRDEPIRSTPPLPAFGLKGAW